MYFFIGENVIIYVVLHKTRVLEYMKSILESVKVILLRLMDNLNERNFNSNYYRRKCLLLRWC